jgi:hypothetical protein
MKPQKELLERFLNKAETDGLKVEPVQALRTNTYSVGRANVLVRTASDLGKRYFFGLNYINAEEVYNLENSFIAFICGDIGKIVLLPTDVLISHLPEISHDRNGEYKINFTRDLNLVLKGRNNRFDCSPYINNWNLLETSTSQTAVENLPEESIHNVIQGRLIDIGNIRGYETYCPDRSRTFNRKKLGDMMTLAECPKLQFSDYELLRKIDVLWFRKANNGFYPAYGFEVEISTGVWSGFGRLATLRDYDARPYIVTNEDKKFRQVITQFPEIKDRFIHVIPDQVGLLYSAEKNLIEMRKEFNL